MRKVLESPPLCALYVPEGVRFQVSEKGDLENWNIGGDALGGTIGAAMDLAVGAKP